MHTVSGDFLLTDSRRDRREKQPCRTPLERLVQVTKAAEVPFLKEKFRPDCIWEEWLREIVARARGTHPVHSSRD